MGCQYDAFISYRHLPADMAVAEKLQSLLEKKKKQDGTGITVFRDKSDLPTSGNLGSDIREALENARFLIIICSPGYRESAWCMEELRYFRQLHGDTNANILPVLVDGEPEDVFPALIRFEHRPMLEGSLSAENEWVEVEPLGADVRDPSLREQLKKLKTEYLRIAAPILGVRFDDLYRRHRRRKRLVAAAVAVALAAFCVYSLVLFLQIGSRQQQVEEKQQQVEEKQQQLTDKQQELYQKESVRLANEALSLVGSDNALAMLIANAALPEDLENPEYPVTAEAELAIRSSVLQDMIGKHQAYFALRYQISFDTRDWKVGEFFGNGKYLPVYDSKTVWIYETQTGQLIAMLPKENEDYFFCEDQQVGKIWVVRLTWNMVGNQQNYNYTYGYINEDGGITETPTLPEQIQKVYEEQGIGIMNTEHNASMWSMIVGEYSTYDYEKMPPEYQKIWDIFCELDMPNKPHAISITDDRRLALIQFQDAAFEPATAFWAVEEERLLWVSQEGCFWEKGSGLIYRVGDTQLQVYTYQPEVFPQNLGILGTDNRLPHFDYVSEDGSYGFLRCTVDEDRYNGALVAYKLTDLGQCHYAQDIMGNYMAQRLGNCLFWADVLDGLFAVTPDGKFVGMVNAEGELWVIDVEAEQVTASYTPPEGDPMGVAIDDDGSFAAFAVREDKKCTILILDRVRDQILETITVPEPIAVGQNEVHLAINDGRLLVTMDNRAYLYTLDALQEEPLVVDIGSVPGFAAQRNWDCSFTADGLLLVPGHEEAAQGIQKRIRGIVDLNTGKTVGFEGDNSYQREDFFYDDIGGYLIIRNGNSFAVQRRNAGGDFREIYTINPRNVDMELVAGGHAADGTWLLLQNDQWCEIYRLEDGALCYLFRKSWDHQFAITDGCLWNFQAGQSQPIPLPNAAQARAYARDAMKNNGAQRVLTDAECEKYYIMDDWRNK